MRLSSSGNDVTLTSMEESDAYGKSKNVLNELLQFYIRLVVFKRLTPLVIYSSFCDTPVIALCSHTRGIIPLEKANVTAPNGAAVTTACGDPSSYCDHVSQVWKGPMGSLAEIFSAYRRRL